MMMVLERFRVCSNVWNRVSPVTVVLPSSPLSRSPSSACLQCGRFPTLSSLFLPLLFDLGLVYSASVSRSRKQILKAADSCAHSIVAKKAGRERVAG